jgi:small-conductance mechanosensitive channel
MMELLDPLRESWPKFILFLFSFAVVLVALWLANWFLLRRRKELGEDERFPRRMTMIFLSALGAVAVLLSLPVETETRGQLLGLLGLVLTAVIALSSTTFVANIMAGLMMRAVRSFRPGDFVQVEEQFGRVTERGLFHTEIQTQDRDLVTLPNLYLVTNPIRVVRTSGTIIAATVSLGYDQPHTRVEELLREAALAAKLEEPFVQVKNLGDFSVTYRVAGFLADVKGLLTARSKLRAAMLDVLHGGGVEIVSPTFMNQRQLREGAVTMPPLGPRKWVAEEADPGTIPEELIFDKAEAAEKQEGLKLRRDTLVKDIESLQARVKEAEEPERLRLQARIDLLQRRVDFINGMLKSAKEDPEKK